jgi:hypothetical protein
MVCRHRLSTRKDIRAAYRTGGAQPTFRTRRRCHRRSSAASRESLTGGGIAWHSAQRYQRRRPCTRPLEKDNSRLNRGGVDVQNSSHLVSPEQLVSTPVLDPIPYAQKLGNPVRPNVVGVLLRVVPCEGCTERQETHARRVGWQGRDCSELSASRSFSVYWACTGGHRRWLTGRS